MSWSLPWSALSPSLPQRLDPTPAEARTWLGDELHKASYQEPWLDSVIRWFMDHLRALFNGASQAANSGISAVVTLLVALVVIALLVWVLPRVRREPAAARPEGAVLDDLAITAAAYRELASRALAEGRFEDAVLNGFRAIAKDMSDRTLLDDAPGRTAHEVSLALWPAFPGYAGRLAQAADLFDAVRYGRRPASADQASLVQQLDAELIKTRPVLATSSPLQDLSV
jgi:hypothetical protein